ncbi:hypothetical protein K458DRAFT_126645 [Lentithecium fluviatile CBS 122367]|uniref:Uncharacterized protein n=1 Tax=Lentithecium fluviatile CBS 122367 TaxID=1168545 RepID=A0A6G1JGI1_9PLEO|nr:hypothetical protein K458DRAFT_126645 [Lentithecium fluviatile CBS 122367]
MPKLGASKNVILRKGHFQAPISSKVARNLLSSPSHAHFQNPKHSNFGLCQQFAKRLDAYTPVDPTRVADYSSYKSSTNATQPVGSASVCTQRYCARPPESRFDQQFTS